MWKIYNFFSCKYNWFNLCSTLFEAFNGVWNPWSDWEARFFCWEKKKMSENSNPQMKFYIKNELFSIYCTERKILCFKIWFYISKRILSTVWKDSFTLLWLPSVNMFWENVCPQINKKYTNCWNYCHICTWPKVSQMSVKTILASRIHSLGPLETFWS